VSRHGWRKDRDRRWRNSRGVKGRAVSRIVIQRIRVERDRFWQGNGRRFEKDIKKGEVWGRGGRGSRRVSMMKMSVHYRVFIEHCVSAFNYSACNAHPELPCFSGFRVAQKNATLSFGGQLMRTVAVLDMDIRFATKQAEMTEIRNAVEPGHIRGGDGFQSPRRAANQEIHSALGCLRPEATGKGGSGQEAADHLTDGLVETFNHAILLRCTSTGKLLENAKVGKEGCHGIRRKLPPFV
jgi:hypothetical protein